MPIIATEPYAPAGVEQHCLGCGRLLGTRAAPYANAEMRWPVCDWCRGHLPGYLQALILQTPDHWATVRTGWTWRNHLNGFLAFWATGDLDREPGVSPVPAGATQAEVRSALDRFVGGMERKRVEALDGYHRRGKPTEAVFKTTGAAEKGSTRVTVVRVFTDQDGPNAAKALRPGDDVTFGVCEAVIGVITGDVITLTESLPADLPTGTLMQPWVWAGKDPAGSPADRAAVAKSIRETLLPACDGAGVSCKRRKAGGKRHTVRCRVAKSRSLAPSV